MNLILQFLTCAFTGYIIGGINPSYLISRARGFDIRRRGSGNAGASNALITMGKKTGLLCALLDIYKAYLAVKLSLKLFPFLETAGILAGACCILGHIYPVFMHFRGGKGLAALGGVILAYDKKTFLTLLVIELIIVLIIDYICTVPLSASVLFTVILQVECGFAFALIFLPVVAVLFAKHKQNFKRIKYGIEMRVSYLWNKNRELLRVQNNFAKLTDLEKNMFPEISL